MCFAPQRSALFRHLNFQKWYEPLVFLTFWLCLATFLPFRASASSFFWLFLFYSSFLSFSLLTLSLLLFFLLIFLFSLPLPCSAFHLSILSEVWLLNFLRLATINQYKGATSRNLPSMNLAISEIQSGCRNISWARRTPQKVFLAMPRLWSSHARITEWRAINNHKQWIHDIYSILWSHYS